MSLSLEAARAFESGRLDGVLSRVLAAAVAPVAARAIARPARIPAEIALVCIGGATLGGSGKTRLALACARELAASGRRVVLVGHAYRAAPPSARVVSIDDPLDVVGDEALVCARELAPSSVPVVIGPTRQAAIDHAVALGPAPDVLVLDGPLAVRGRSRARSLSLLAVDANRPWGSGRLPPAGDLRAAREVLLAHADHVVPVDATPSRVRWDARDRTSIASLRAIRYGLFTAIARPDRLVRALTRLGAPPHVVVSVRDHGPLGSARARLERAPVDAWVATPKCALHLVGAAPGTPRIGRFGRLGILESELALPAPVREALGDLRSRWEECAPRLHGVP